VGIAHVNVPPTQLSTVTSLKRIYYNTYLRQYFPVNELITRVDPIIFNSKRGLKQLKGKKMLKQFSLVGSILMKRMETGRGVVVFFGIVMTNDSKDLCARLEFVMLCM